MESLAPIVERLKSRFSIGSVCIVADRGMISAETLKEVAKRGWRYILGMRMRSSTKAKAMVARAGRYAEVNPKSDDRNDPSPLKVKQVWVEGARRYAVCLARSYREVAEVGLCLRVSVEAAKRKLGKIRGHQDLRSLLCYNVDPAEQGLPRISVWSDWEEYQRLVKRYFGLRILITDRAEWSTAQIIEAYRGQSNVESAFSDLKEPRRRCQAFCVNGFSGCGSSGESVGNWGLNAGVE